MLRLFLFSFLPLLVPLFILKLWWLSRNSLCYMTPSQLAFFIHLHTFTVGCNYWMSANFIWTEITESICIWRALLRAQMWKKAYSVWKDIAKHCGRKDSELVCFKIKVFVLKWRFRFHCYCFQMNIQLMNTVYAIRNAAAAAEIEKLMFGLNRRKKRQVVDNTTFPVSK